ncbi:sulfite exporter TauE/SafE family protein [Zoogloea sp.]|uniref:sulfite exporter TauE/SafE family protein n=1 Tax=Zoogloea sp. TaxID=49181 RepID=UPI0035B3FCD3
MPALLFSTTDISALAAAFAILVVAYAIFSLLGFGSALIASTPMAWVMPVSRVVPLLALLDAVGSLQRGYQARRLIDRSSLGRLVPGMLAGQLVGVSLLAHLPLDILAMLLGLFVAGYGLRELRGRRGSATPGQGAAWLYGAFGGVLGGLFGSGGFVYATYLQAHLPGREAYRATQAVMIALSTGWRIALCVAAGLIEERLLLTALALLPAAYLGMALGRHVDQRLSGAGFTRLLNLFLVASGLALIGRGVRQVL